MGGILLRGGGRPFLRGSAACLALGAALLGAASSLHPAQVGALLLGLGAAGIVLVTPVLLAGAGAGPMARAVGNLTGLRDGFRRATRNSRNVNS